jgi:hypothetical protein
MSAAHLKKSNNIVQEWSDLLYDPIPDTTKGTTYIRLEKNVPWLEQG